MELRQGWPGGGAQPPDQPGAPDAPGAAPAPAGGWGEPSQWGAPAGRGQPVAPPPAARPLAPHGRPGQGNVSPLRRAWQRIVATLAAIGAFIAKFGVLLVKLKYLTVIGSMLVSIAAYTWLWGWTFAVGFVLLMLVHEMGHVIVLKRQGVPASLPLFVPFLGAFVSMKGSPRSAYEEAQSGLAGPAFGVAGAIVVAAWGNAIGSSFLLRLAFVGFFLNLFNLLPALPLDGGRAAAALHPVIWLVGLVGLLVFEILYPSPIVPIILLLGGYELWQRWRHRGSRASQAYYALLPQQRAVIGALYLGIVAVALIGFHATYLSRSF